MCLSNKHRRAHGSFKGPPQINIYYIGVHEFQKGNEGSIYYKKNNYQVVLFKEKRLNMFQVLSEIDVCARLL